MEWWVFIIIFFGILLILMVSGIPIAFCFLIMNLGGAYIFWGGVSGFNHLIISIFRSITIFTLLPIPLFVLMGELLFHSGMSKPMFSTIDKWLGRIRGRLALVAVGGGVGVAALSGSTIASAAMLGEILIPEMEMRGYKKSMSIGPIIGSAGMAIVIPPSSMAILLATIAKVSAGKLLIAGVIPGLFMGCLYSAYILVRCYLQPSLAPAYDMIPPPISEKIKDTVKYVLPFGLVVFSVIGLVLLGIATPSEGAASGALSTFILAALYRKFSWSILKNTLASTIRVTIMMLMIMTSAAAFSQMLALSGASESMAKFTVSLPVASIFILISMHIAILFLGMFIEQMSIMMITLPIFMPVVHALGFDEIWFTIMMLINLEIANRTPPFGFNLFVMKGVAPNDTTMADIWQAAIPFVIIDFMVVILIIIFPKIALWLPSFF